MSAAILDWLQSFGTTVFRLCAIAFLVVNAAAVAAVAVTRDRALVNRFTSPWLGANLVLIGVGAGTPLIAGLARMAVQGLAAAGGILTRLVE